MPTPSEPTSPYERTEELRARLRPRGPTGWPVGPSERLALERIQALEVQIAAAHERERSLTELAVRDGNRIAGLGGPVEELADLAAPPHPRPGARAVRGRGPRRERGPTSRADGSGADVDARRGRPAPLACRRA